MTLRAITKDKEIIGVINDDIIDNKDFIKLLAVLTYPINININIIAIDVAFKEYGYKFSAGLYNSFDESAKMLLDNWDYNRWF